VTVYAVSDQSSQQALISVHNRKVGGFENGQVLSQTWTLQHWLCGWGEEEGRGSHF